MFSVHHSDGRRHSTGYDHPEDAAQALANIGEPGASIRSGRLLLWTEGADGSAADSYDHVADVVWDRFADPATPRVSVRKATVAAQGAPKAFGADGTIGDGCFTGPAAVDTFRAITLASSLGLYGKHGIFPSRGIGLRDMLRLATEYTGRTFRASKAGALDAETAVREWAYGQRAALNGPAAP